jgi:hypothetical protein
MDTMIAYCGLSCQSCPIHLATLEQDSSKQQTMRAEIARMCKEQYGMNVTIQDITDCDGCRAQTGRLFSGCAKCEIRACAIGKALTSCAYCSDYSCEKLLKHFQTDPTARTRLETMRSEHRSQTNH